MFSSLKLLPISDRVLVEENNLKKAEYLDAFELKCFRFTRTIFHPQIWFEVKAIFNKTQGWWPLIKTTSERLDFRAIDLIFHLIASPISLVRVCVLQATRFHLWNYLANDWLTPCENSESSYWKISVTFIPADVKPRAPLNHEFSKVPKSWQIPDLSSRLVSELPRGLVSFNQYFILDRAMVRFCWRWKPAHA